MEMPSARSRWQNAMTQASNLWKSVTLKQNSVETNDKIEKASLRKSGGHSTQSSIQKSVAFRMSILHVTTFIVCWTPYAVIQLWHIVDKCSVKSVSDIVQDILFLICYFNSCINPVVYGGFYLKNFQKNMSTSNRQTLNLMQRSKVRWLDVS